MVDLQTLKIGDKVRVLTNLTNIEVRHNPGATTKIQETIGGKEVEVTGKNTKYVVAAGWYLAPEWVELVAPEPVKKTRVKHVKIVNGKNLKARTKVIQTTPEEWKKATDNWAIVKKGTTKALSADHILNLQKPLRQALSDNPKSLIGQSVLIATGDTGTFWADYPYRGTILDVKDTTLVVQALIDQNNHHYSKQKGLDFPDVHSLPFWQLILVKDLQELPQELVEKIVFDPVLALVNQVRLGEKKNLEYNLADYKRSIETYKNYVKDYKQKVVTYQQRVLQAEQDLKRNVTKEWTVEELKAKIDEVGKNPYVEWARLTTDGYLIVQTKMLYRYDTVKECLTKTPVGRYAFRLYVKSPGDASPYCWPLDFEYQSYRHPNTSNTGVTCWGQNSYPVTEALTKGEYFTAVDSLILFFSSFPHDGGHQPMFHMIWLNNRNWKFKQNPWIKEPAVYTVGTFSEPQPLDFPLRDKRKTLVINKKRENIVGRTFWGH